MSKEEFYLFYFEGGFQMAELWVHQVKPHLRQLDCIRIQDHEKEYAVKAAEALYDIAAKITWLHFILRPGGDLALALMAIGMFAKTKYDTIQQGIRQLESQSKSPSEQESPAEGLGYGY